MGRDGVPVIAIDGPSGSGKGTIALALAEQLGWHRLDSGALYRLVALAAVRANVHTEDVDGLADIARGLDVAFGTGPAGEESILLDGEEVSRDIRSESCGAAASRIAALPQVRDALVEHQRGLCQAPGLVADGRDMGSVIFPAAQLKVFLTASPEERAVRRHKQLKEKGINVSLAGLSADIAERDQRDAARPVAPLKPCDDAVVVDTTGLTVEDVVARVLGLARGVFGPLIP